MPLLGGQLITFNSYLQISQTTLSRTEKEREDDGYYRENKTPWELAKADFLLSQSCICLLAALLLSCWETNQDYTVISKSMSLVAYKNEGENRVGESKA